jgi:predicted nucleotidyltransferase
LSGFSPTTRDEQLKTYLAKNEEEQIGFVLRIASQHIDGAFLFGSSARGTRNANSDIDICLLCPPRECFAITDFVKANLPFPEYTVQRLSNYEKPQNAFGRTGRPVHVLVAELDHLLASTPIANTIRESPITHLHLA